MPLPERRNAVSWGRAVPHLLWRGTTVAYLMEEGRETTGKMGHSSAA